MTLLYGPRPVNIESHRVCLPKTLSAAVQLDVGSHARIDQSQVREGELVVKAVGSPAGAHSHRDPARPRRVTAHGQLTLPYALLTQVGVSREQPFVYFALSPEELALRIIPAHRVNVSLGGYRG